MSPEELAGLVCQTLRRAGITVTLTGGACVAIWSRGKYVSHDLDFVEEGPVPRRRVTEVLGSIGFQPKGRHYVHPETPFFVEFPTGPLMVGEERIERVVERDTAGGRLRLLSPTDCVKDRLPAFFHWNDRQALEQAVLVATAELVDLKDVRRWSEGEREAEKFSVFEQSLPSAKQRNPKRRGRGKRG